MMTLFWHNQYTINWEKRQKTKVKPIIYEGNKSKNNYRNIENEFKRETIPSPGWIKENDSDKDKTNQR